VAQELISDLLGKALLLYQQCNQDADTLTPPQQRMWIDVLILSAKDLLYQVQQGNASNKKLLQRRTENAIGHLSQVCARVIIGWLLMLQCGRQCCAAYSGRPKLRSKMPLPQCG
jgi:hypothetical protein